MTRPDRDASIDRLLSRPGWSGDVPEASPQCLDPNTLAAWADGSLRASEAAAAEAHAAACARCQATLAALVRVLPPTSVGQPWWRRRWLVAGLVPLTAGAIALALWIKSPEPARLNTSPIQQGQASAPAAPLETRREAPSTAEATRAKAPPPPALDRVDATRRSVKEAPPQGNVGMADRKKAEARQKNSEAKTDALAAAPPPVQGQAKGLNESAARSQFRSNAVEIASPDAANRWRIGAGGSIQRSTDAGATWEAQTSGVSQDLLAGVAVSPSLCWVVGRSGTVLLSTDGRSWQVVPFPESSDLVAVQARDARSATVTTGDRRTFRTADGGRTWTALQEF